MASIEGIRIILVEPAGERNIGSIARVMCNMKLKELVIVNPRCDYFSEDAQIMAVHGIDVLKQAVIVDSLPLALQGCQRAIATTSRTKGIPTYLETPREAIPWLLVEGIKSALIFGPEDRGLSNNELSYAQKFVCIPANEDYPSLNLAQAVAICAYEIHQTFINYNPLEKLPIIEKDLATLDELSGYYQHLESVLLQVNYLYPHTANATMAKIKKIINNAPLEKSDLAMLRGMLRQVEWGLKNHQNKLSSEFGVRS